MRKFFQNGLRVLLVSSALVHGSSAVFAQTQADANALLRATPDVYNGLFTAALVKHLADSCPDTIEPPGRLARVAYFLRLYGKARGLGLSRNQIETFVEDETEQERMRQLVYSYLRNANVDPMNEQAVCAYGSDQIAQATALGKRLREK